MLPRQEVSFRVREQGRSVPCEPLLGLSSRILNEISAAVCKSGENSLHSTLCFLSGSNCHREKPA